LRSSSPEGLESSTVGSPERVWERGIPQRHPKGYVEIS
jgi:hypothetical protein